MGFSFSPNVIIKIIAAVEVFTEYYGSALHDSDLCLRSFLCNAVSARHRESPSSGKAEEGERREEGDDMVQAML